MDTTQPTVLRQTEWLDGDAFSDLEAFFARILQSAGRCVLCDAEQPDDVRWPAYTVELQSKDDGESAGEYGYRACHQCEPQLDRLLDRLGAK